MGKHQYGLVFDAGSSGTRVYIYQWLNAEAARADDDGEHLTELPKIKTKKDWIKKVKPGVSTFGTKPEKVGPEHLKELVDFALSVVPKRDVAQTPIFLLATAGMRLLPDNQRSAVLENICSYFQKNTKFQLPDCAMHVQVIPGETEGLYGWVAANYLLGGFDASDAKHHTKSKNTYGFLDMGGASAQIAFAPNATESEKHWNDLKLLKLRRINGQELDYRVFVTTWLGFGANEARRRYVEKLLESYSAQEHEVPDPCLPRGITAKKTGEEIKPGSAELQGKDAHLIGTGMFPECLKRTYPLLEKEKACADPPCLLDGVHTPNIDFNVNHFVGVSEFWHTTHGVFKDSQKKKAYDFETYQKQVEEFCSQDWKSLEAGVASGKWGVKVDVKEVEEVCFKASWLINVLHMGIGVPRIGLEHMNSTTNKTEALIDNAKDKGFIDAFQAVDKIDGKELSWTLGKIVLYASSQIPPADGAAAVGFGSNVKDNSIPKDFQYAGGAPVLYKPEHDDDDDDDDHDYISLKGHYARRVPGILIFLLILLLAGYLLCGRDRRTALYNKFLTMLGRKPSSGAIRLKRKKAAGNGFGKLFGGAGGANSPSYERVLEEATPEDFELADVSSDDGSDRHSASSHSGIDPHSGTAAGVSARSGRTSGMNTPANRGMSPDTMRTSPKVGSLSSLGLGPASGAFERSGLSSRSESRRASPSSRAMGRTPLGAGKESVD
jgi:Golgi nucleoside diphosphatase